MVDGLNLIQLISAKISCFRQVNTRSLSTLICEYVG